MLPVPALAHGQEAFLGLAGDVLGLALVAAFVLFQALRRRLAPTRAAVALFGALAGAALPFAINEVVARGNSAMDASTWFALGISCPVLIAGTVLLWPRLR